MRREPPQQFTIVCYRPFYCAFKFYVDRSGSGFRVTRRTAVHALRGPLRHEQILHLVHFNLMNLFRLLGVSTQVVPWYRGCTFRYKGCETMHTTAQILVIERLGQQRASQKEHAPLPWHSSTRDPRASVDSGWPLEDSSAFQRTIASTAIYRTAELEDYCSSSPAGVR